jgi:tripartite-type tricarboxylate transporter receptor subunit TctC
LTTYSKNASYERGTNTNQIIDRINKRLDNINQSKDLKRISNEKYIKLNYKYRDKLSNLIKDIDKGIKEYFETLAKEEK